MSINIRDRIVEFKRVNASELTPHPQNWRKHPQEQKDAMSGILQEIGYVDALMVRKHDGGYQIIDGHLRAETTPDVAVPVLIVDLNDAEAASVLATFDPIAAMANTDRERLAELLSQIEPTTQAMADLLKAIESENIGGDDTYTKKVKAPIYEPTGSCPTVEELYDLSKASALCVAIDASDASPILKDFLKASAQRHIVYNYALIAEYYAHASPDVQRLMEQSALVIIDFNKAIEYGFVTLSESLNEQLGSEYGI